jgi:hypothetical protein
MRPSSARFPKTPGEVRLTRDALHVTRVKDGSEATVKELLQTAVRRANDELIRRGLAQEKAAEREQAEVNDDAETADRMTDRFRAPPPVG